MGPRALSFSVACYLACILCRNTSGESTFAKVFSSTNNVSGPAAGVPRREDTQIERTAKADTELIGIMLKERERDDFPKFDIPQESPSSLSEDLSSTVRVSNGSREAKCSMYCIEQLGGGKNRPFEDINLFWSFSENEREADKFSLENNPKLKITKRPSSIDNMNLTISEDNCEIYLNLGCNVVNVEGSLVYHQRDKFNSGLKSGRRDAEISEDFLGRSALGSSKKLVHRTNLRGYTETGFHVNANVTEMVISIWGNLTRAVLAIPISRTTKRPGITMSLVRTYDMKGVAIGARNPPPGGWLVKLTGMENSNYSFDVLAYFGASEESDAEKKEKFSALTPRNGELGKKEEFDGASTASKAVAMLMNKTNELNKPEREARKNIVDARIEPTLLVNPGISKRPKFMFERSVEIMDGTVADEFPSVPLFSSEKSVIIQNSINHFVPHNNSLSYGISKIPQNASSNRVVFDNGMITQQQQNIQERSSEVTSLNEDIDMKLYSPHSSNVSLKMSDGDRSQQFSAQFAENNNESILKRRAGIEVNVNSKLIVQSGMRHEVLFDITNNCLLNVFYSLRVQSSSFRYIVPVRFIRLHPRQTLTVPVFYWVPPGASANTANTLTLSIGDTQIASKTVYIYVQDTSVKPIDETKPTIEFSFNNNCAGKLDRNRCDKTFWSADVTVQSYNLGLMRVTATPNEIHPRTEFISGTKDRVSFQYISTCCTTTAIITAVDLLNNRYSRTIDVTVWDNLSQGEIAAITLGALFLLLLLILIIIAIILCVRKRNSHDLPYTQRYGSRPPARSERTSF